MQLKGKRILLTGATGGLGQDLTIALVKKGAELTLVGRDEVKLVLLKNSLTSMGGTVHIVPMDLSAESASTLIAKAARKSMGSIDILINNAGILDFIKFEEQPAERIAQMVHTNVTAPIQLTNAVIPEFLLKNNGHVVFIGSIFGSLGFPHFSTYCASKFAIHGFAQSLRRELFDTGIGVTYIAPRGINTPMNDANTVAMWEHTGGKMDDPAKVANRIIQALEKEQEEVFIGQPQSFFAWLNGICPRMVSIGIKKDTITARQYL